MKVRCLDALVPLVLAVMLLSGSAWATARDDSPEVPDQTLNLSLAERLALARDAGLSELAQRGEAARDSAVAAGALPDPQLNLGLSNLPVDSFDLEDDMMAMLMVGVRQSFPAGQSRQLSREQGELAGRRFDAEYQAREREVKRQLRLAWTGWAYAERQLALAREEAESFEELVNITRSRYRSGLGSQRDLSRASLELAAVEERILSLETDRDMARAELQRWTGRLPADIRPGEGQLPAIASLNRLSERLVDHPLLEAARHQIEVADKGVEIARQGYRPSWMLEASYGYRQAREMDGSRASDSVSMMVGLSLPLFTGDRQDRELSAARADARADHYRRMDRLHEMQGQLEREYARYQRRLELESLFEERLLAEAGQYLELEFSAYRADRGDFRDLIRARVDELDYRLRLLQVQQQLAESRIELNYLAGDES
ncbi:TolC family protein [Natronospira bacteriovora]|uniref:TolC family protein n=1 Tax=Natronospira bacteriovora TaxID=3069753 RepID=A0ABU0W8I0_9GAMM|nr:TolC family protein [Natronospira sp. AB-CW4]MDQ2070344.1 TolC family protein [Natronospira sp. AB-CW4]